MKPLRCLCLFVKILERSCTPRCGIRSPGCRTSSSRSCASTCTTSSCVGGAPGARWQVRGPRSTARYAHSLGTPRAGPCLPVREDMHEKRNEARAKLSALSHQRFLLLVDDVVRELVGRYPELGVQAMSAYTSALRYACLLRPFIVCRRLSMTSTASILDCITMSSIVIMGEPRPLTRLHCQSYLIFSLSNSALLA